MNTPIRLIEEYQCPETPTVLALAVAAWLVGYGAEADARFFTVCIEQGVLRPTEIDEGAYIEHGAREFGCVHIFLHVGSILQINADGTVAVC